jgi:hypothetical protein
MTAPTMDNPIDPFAEPVDEAGLRANVDRLVDDAARADLWWWMTTLREQPDFSALFDPANPMGAT